MRPEFQVELLGSFRETMCGYSDKGLIIGYLNKNHVDNIPYKINSIKSNIADLKADLLAAQTRVDTPFEYQEELEQFLQKQAEINSSIEFIDDMIVDDEEEIITEIYEEEEAVI